MRVVASSSSSSARIGHAASVGRSSSTTARRRISARWRSTAASTASIRRSSTPTSWSPSARARRSSTAARRRSSTRARAGTIRSSRAVSLLEPGSATGWRLAGALESELERSAPVIGLSLVLDRPRATGLHRGYPWSAEGRRALARSPFRRLLNLSPAAVRRRVLAGHLPRGERRRRPGRTPDGCSRRGPRPRGVRAQRHRAAAARHDRRASSLGRTAPATRAAQPDHRGRPGPRTRAPPLARPAAARGGRRRRPPSPVLARDGPRSAGAVPSALRRAARRKRPPPARRGGARGAGP